MNLRRKIEKLNDLEKRLYVEVAANVGLAGFAYATDMKGLVYIGCSLALGFCLYGIYNNNQRNELIRQENVQNRFGGNRR